MKVWQLFSWLPSCWVILDGLHYSWSYPLYVLANAPYPAPFRVVMSLELLILEYYTVKENINPAHDFANSP